MNIHETAFHHVVKKLDNQRVDIANLRNQAAIAAAVSGLIATVFATLLAAEKSVESLFGDFLLGFSLIGLFALICFAGSILFSVLVVVHWRDFNFSFDTEIMIEQSVEKTHLEEFFRKYIKDGEWYFRDNEKSITKAQMQLWWAMTLGFTQTIPWSILLMEFS